MNIINAEIYVIEKTIKWINNLMQFSSNIWFFTDSQKSIKLIENSKHMLVDQIYQNLIKNQINDVTSHIHWISEHANIPNNEKADQLAKLTLNINVIRPCEIRNLHAVQAGQCFLMRVANIWSRLLKHNWWNLLYERICTHSDVFFGLTFNENSPLYGYINRASPEFQPMHVYGQQLWFLFHRCEPLSLFLDSWR